MTKTPLRTLLILAAALALVGGGGTVLPGLVNAFFPNWTVIFTWTGEGRNPAAFALSVGKGHNKVGQRDWNEVGYRGRFARSGTAKSGDIIVASGLPTEPHAYMTCVLSIHDRVVDRDPNDGGEPVRGNGALCRGVMP